MNWQLFALIGLGWVVAAVVVALILGKFIKRGQR